MAALLRSQDALDLETAIREWQSRQNERQHGGPAPEPDEKSAVARLTAALDTLFRDILMILSNKGKFPRDIFISLDRSRSCFSLWSDGHGVASGSLDDKFQRSRKLRQATMKTLSHLSSTLIDRLIPVAHISNPKIKGLCDQLSNILEEVNFSHLTDDSSTDSTSEYSTVDVHELAEDLKTDVDCLIELDQMIRDPATDPEPEMTEADVSLSSWAPHQIFANKIEHRFPRADARLFSSLGMVNYQRYLRCQIERDRNQVHAEQAEQVVEVTTGSKFHDSGLGSSLNPASSYAETIMSYRDGNRSIRIPSLPKEAKRGEAFPCVACGRSVIITTNSQWKRHLYIDLQPYVCLDTLCQRSDSTFPNHANWLQHLALDHGMEPTWEQIKCPLCEDKAGPGKIAITTHLGRHLEEISLSALPTAPDSETNSEASESDIDNSYRANQDDDEEPQDLELSLFRSGELSDQIRNNSLSVQSSNPLIDAANREAAGGATGDPPPIVSGHLASPYVRPKSGDEVLVKYLQAGRDPMQITDVKVDEINLDWDQIIPAEKLAEIKAEEDKRQHELYLAQVMDEGVPLRVAFKSRNRETDRADRFKKRQKEQREEEEEERQDLVADLNRPLTDKEQHVLQALRDTAMQQEKRKKTDEVSHEPEVQIHNGKEAAFHRRMGEMKTAQEEAKREIEKARIEAEEASYQRLKAEQKAEEEERVRLYAQAIAAGDEATYQRIEAERAEKDRLRAEPRAMEARRQSEAEAWDSVGAEWGPEMFEVDEATQESLEASRKIVRKAVEALGGKQRSRSSALVSEPGNGESKAGESHETGEDGERRRAGSDATPNWGFEQPAVDTHNSIPSAAPSRRGATAKAEAHDKAEAEARQDFDIADWTPINVHLVRDYVKDKVFSGSPRQEVSDGNAGVEHDQRLDGWQTRRWRWVCPSCGSEDQDQRKGPVCRNCSYLFGDGDGFEASVPEQRQPQDDEIVTEEQLQMHHQGSPEYQATFTFYSPDPLPGDLDLPLPRSNFIGPQYMPRELDLMKHRAEIDNHTSTANHPLSGFNSNDPPVLPPIQLGNAQGMKTQLPSLDEDTDLAEGFRDNFRDRSLVTDLAEQRRRANRMAQRAYRQKLKRRLEDLERRAGATDGQGSDQSGTSKDGALNDIPTSPAQRPLGSPRDRDRDPDVYQEISYESDHDTPHSHGHDFPTGPQESAPVSMTHR
ncbi:hypothetical protein LCI18_003640 [Fusarium solani-melongenae]|uniref:Uncharacterized protein n=1 Tax=Fusarium solani subsp. cucurbitae TaxID=2747967 RepID=A0ACD3YUV1_FUSSC|nr:hypothetical protein LCI18_003640 [Fusarium solani-melongenae]